jgi:CysZ protein
VGSANLTEKPRPAVGELLAGAGLLTRGLSLIVRRPRMFLLGAIPPAITSVIFTGLLIALITQLEPAVDWLTPFADGWARGLATTIRVIVGTTLVAGSVLLMVHRIDPRARLAALRQVVRICRARVR